MTEITHALSSPQSLSPYSICILQGADDQVSVELLVVERKSEKHRYLSWWNYKAPILKFRLSGESPYLSSSATWDQD